jgi:hypothetical protein
MYIPFRFNVGITDRVWFGARSGLNLWNYWFTSNHWYIPLGFQGGVRLIRQIDIMFDLVFPEFFHEHCDAGPADCSRNHIVLFNVWGFGVSLLVRIPG